MNNLGKGVLGIDRDYRDGEHIANENDITKEIEAGNVNDNVKELAQYIVQKKHGKDVRYSLALAILLEDKKFNDYVGKFDNLSDLFDFLNNHVSELEDEFKEVIANATVDSEVINARGSSRFGKFKTLDDRLENDEKILSDTIPSDDFSIKIEHNLGRHVSAKVWAYEDAIGTEVSGLATGFFGGTDSVEVPIAVSSNSHYTTIKMPLKFKLEGRVRPSNLYKDMWLLIDKNKTLKIKIFKETNIDEPLEKVKIDNDLKTKVDEFKAKLPTNQFKMAIISDSHYENRIDETVAGSYPYSSDAFKHLDVLNYLADSVDVIVANGDAVNGLNGSISDTKNELINYADNVLTGLDVDRFMQLGNHDDGSPAHRNEIDKILSETELKTIFKTSQLKNNEVRNKDSLYFYKDYPESNIRLIGLNSEDVPDESRDKFPRWLTHTYSQEQIDWLAKVALVDVPENYQVVVISHTPLSYGWKDSGARQFNSDIVKGILDAFSTGSAYTGSSMSIVPDELKISIRVDYSKQGTRSVAGYIAGHIHREITQQLDNFTMTTVMNDVNTQPENEAGSYESMAITVYSFDLDNREVNLFGLGRATDRSYKY